MTFILAGSCDDFGLKIKNTSDYDIVVDVNYNKGRAWDHTRLFFYKNMKDYEDTSVGRQAFKAENINNNAIEINFTIKEEWDNIPILIQPMKIKLNISSSGSVNGNKPWVEYKGKLNENIPVTVRFMGGEPGECGKSIAKASVLVGKIITMQRK